MLFEFLSKQKDLEKKKKLVKIMILSLNIPEMQKKLYLDSIEIVDKNCIEELYKNLTRFSEEIEFEKIEKIKKENFSVIAWMRKNEKIEQQKEINSFSLLINNL